MMSKKWLASLSDVPQRTEGSPVYDAAIAATPADGDPAKPVGLGAFTFQSYTPGNGNSFKAVRNPDYWRGPNGITGEDLPYLDAIEAVVYVDVDSRSNAVRSGDVDAIHTANADSDQEPRSTTEADLETIIDQPLRRGQLPACSTSPQGARPIRRVTTRTARCCKLPCRQALAAAIDLERCPHERGGGISRRPPTARSRPARSATSTTAATRSTTSIRPRRTWTSASPPAGRAAIELHVQHHQRPVQRRVEPAHHLDVAGRVRRQGEDDDHADRAGPVHRPGAHRQRSRRVGWRNHGGLDPDQQRLWWQSASSTPIGSPALNFGRFKDPVIDDALDTIKSNPDPAARKAAAETINKQFGSQVYNLWLTHTVWGVVAQPYVNGIESNKLPDGTKGIGLAFAGAAPAQPDLVRQRQVRVTRAA